MDFSGGPSVITKILVNKEVERSESVVGDTMTKGSQSDRKGQESGSAGGLWELGNVSRQIVL